MTSERPSDRESAQQRLAKERLRLAQERTTLAHIRTGFASFLFGIAVFGLFGHLLTNLIGGFFVFAGLVFLLGGWVSYARSNRRTRELLDEVEDTLR